MAKMFILIGCVFLGIGLLMMFLPKFPFLGHLPGDIIVEKKNYTFVFPWVTCLLVSMVLSMLMWFFTRR